MFRKDSSDIVLSSVEHTLFVLQNKEGILKNVSVFFEVSNIFQILSFVFCRTKEVMQVWFDIRMTK